jgi:hypothetical protein
MITIQYVEEGKLLVYLQYELFVKANQSTGEKKKSKMLSCEAIEAHVSARVEFLFDNISPFIRACLIFTASGIHWHKLISTTSSDYAGHCHYQSI